MCIHGYFHLYPSLLFALFVVWIDSLFKHQKEHVQSQGGLKKALSVLMTRVRD